MANDKIIQILTTACALSNFCPFDLGELEIHPVDCPGMERKVEGEELIEEEWTACYACIESWARSK